MPAGWIKGRQIVNELPCAVTRCGQTRRRFPGYTTGSCHRFGGAHVRGPLCDKPCSLPGSRELCQFWSPDGRHQCPVSTIIACICVSNRHVDTQDTRNQFLGSGQSFRCVHHIVMHQSIELYLTTRSLLACCTVTALESCRRCPHAQVTECAMRQSTVRVSPDLLACRPG